MRGLVSLLTRFTSSILARSRSLVKSGGGRGGGGRGIGGICRLLASSLLGCSVLGERERVVGRSVLASSVIGRVMGKREQLASSVIGKRERREQVALQESATLLR